MATFEVKAPDGSSWEVTAPDNATESQVLEYAKSQWKAPKERSFAEDVGRQVGLSLRAPAKAALSLGGLGTMVGDAIFGLAGQPGRTSQGLDNLLNKVFPSPETPTERVSQDVAGSLAGMAGMASAGQLIGRAAVSGSVTDTVARALYSNLPAQTLSTAAASGASGITRESGGGPGSQLAAGLIAGVGAPMAAQAAVNMGPQAVLKRSMERSAATPFAREGERLAQDTGIELTPGARTGNRFMTAMENTARQYSPTADRVQDVDIKIANQAIARVNTLADQISKNKGDPETLGNRIMGTVQAAARKLDDMRRSVADRDYAAVRDIAGDGKVIRLQSFADELGKIIDDYSNVAGSDAQKVVAQARAALGRITGVIEQGTPTRTIQTPAGNGIRLYGSPTVSGTLDNTIDEALKTRSFYGQASRGGANVFEDIAPNLQRRLSSRLFRAINEDFDNAADTLNGPLKQALSQANSNYKRASQSIEFLEKSALGKMVGDDLVDAAMTGTKVNTTSGEQIMQRISGMHPSVRRNSIDIISKWNPQLAQDIRAQVLRDALDQAAAIPPSAKGSSQVPISFNRFITALGSQKVSFDKNLESYGFTPKEIKDIRDTASAMLRQGDRTGTNFSNTEVMRQNMEVSQAMGDTVRAGVTGGFSALATGAIGRAVTLAGKRIGMNRIVDAMASDEGRKALRTLSSPKASPQAVLAAFATIDPEQKPQE